MITSAVVRRGSHKFIAAAIEVYITDHPDRRILAITPIMLSYFAPSPARYEVSEVLIITEGP